MKKVQSQQVVYPFIVGVDVSNESMDACMIEVSKRRCILQIEKFLRNEVKKENHLFTAADERWSYTKTSNKVLRHMPDQRLLDVCL